MPDVSGIPLGSTLGTVLIICAIGTFLMVLLGGILALINYSRSKKDRAVKDSHQCQTHDDKIKTLERDVTEIKTTINEGFESIHARIDQVLIIISSNGHTKGQPYSRKG
jgi:hypothetical protein